MSKSYWNCADCGTAVRVDGSNRADADRKAQWHVNQEHICHDCEIKAFGALNAKSIEANQRAGLLPLTGSEKQAAWAETLRAKMLPSIVAACNGNDTAEQVVRSKIRASWWIDHRDTSAASVLVELRLEIAEEQASRDTAPVSDEERAIVEEAQNEALIKPAGTPASQQIAEIKFMPPNLLVSFPEKNEAFRLLVRGMGFVWADRHWKRPMSVTTGSPVDRIAETAHRLIDAGFMVRIHDETAHAKALSATFEPEQTRWITCVVSSGSVYAGWFCITWARSDDLYADAKRILGARYKSGAVYAPPGSSEEVVEFAEQYGFAFSPGADAVIQAHRAALASGIILSDPIKAPKPQRAKNKTRPDVLAISTTGIADELLDNH